MSVRSRRTFECLPIAVETACRFRCSFVARNSMFWSRGHHARRRRVNGGGGVHAARHRRPPLLLLTGQMYPAGNPFGQPKPASTRRKPVVCNNKALIIAGGQRPLATTQPIMLGPRQIRTACPDIGTPESATTRKVRIRRSEGTAEP